MNPKLLFALAAAGLAGVALSADEPAASADAKLPVERYQLKKLSSCVIPAGARQPFWPIGWVHREGPHQEVPIGPKFVLDEKSFAVTSILLGSPAIAVINGRAYEEGQFLKIGKAAPAGAPVVQPTAALPRIRVQRIADGQVLLAYDAQIVAIPLKRPELNERKAEQETLNEDKDEAAPAPAVSKR